MSPFKDKKDISGWNDAPGLNVEISGNVDGNFSLGYAGHFGGDYALIKWVIPGAYVLSWQQFANIYLKWFWVLEHHLLHAFELYRDTEYRPYGGTNIRYLFPLGQVFASGRRR